MRRLLGLVSAMAMMGAGIAPAAARDHGRYGWGTPGYGWSGYRPHRHYRHGGGLDAGDVIGIAALIGAVAVIASAAGKDKAADNRDVEQPIARSEGEWDIEGRIEQRRSYRATEGQSHRFSCEVRDGRVADIRLSADMI